MAYINGKEILFSAQINVGDYEKIKRAIVTKGGNASNIETLDDIPPAILDIPVGDTNYIQVVDSAAAHVKQILTGALDYVMVNKVGGKVSKLESSGANILRFPYGKKQEIGAGYSRTLNGVRFTVLADGGIRREGTATAYSQFVINSDSGAPKLTSGQVYNFSGITNISYYDSLTPEKTYIWAGGAKFWSECYSIHNISLIVQKGETVNDVVYPMIGIGAKQTPYKPYRGVIDTLEIPAEVKVINGFGREGSYIEWLNNKKIIHKVTKSEDLTDLTEPIITDITDLFPRDNLLQIEGDGSIKFVNEENQPVLNEITYLRRLS